MYSVRRKGMEGRKNIGDWVKEHKKELIIGGTAIVAVVGTIIFAKSFETVKDITQGESVNNIIPIYPIQENEKMLGTTNIIHTQNNKIVDISGHIRNLQEGYHHSQQKYIEALECGIELADNQTYVAPYKKGCAA